MEKPTITATAAQNPKEKTTPPDWKLPLLRLRVNDVSSQGSTLFFDHVNATKLLREAVVGVLQALYTPDTKPTSLRSVTLVLRSMGGVAYTTGSEIDDDHKEIHFSTEYIASIPEARVRDEIVGVIRHEMVHCWQYNGSGTCPAGLIEGIADWVRLKDGFSPPHWSRGGSKWDEGYQNTAFFLQWCEERFGEGFVRQLNGLLLASKYSETLWKDITGGLSVEELWGEYKKVYAIGNIAGHDQGADDQDDGGEGTSNQKGGNGEGHHPQTAHTSHQSGGNGDGGMDVVEGEGGTGKEVGLRGAGVDDASGIDVKAEADVAVGGDGDGDGDITMDWLPEEREALFLRHRLQQTFLPDDQKPNPEEFHDADTYFTFLESMENVPASILQKSKLPKILRYISKLEDPAVVAETPYNFRARAQALVERWVKSLPITNPPNNTTTTTSPGDSPISSTSSSSAAVPFKKDILPTREELMAREEVITISKFMRVLGNLEGFPRRAFFLNNSEAVLGKLPREVQREANEYRRQVGLGPVGGASGGGGGGGGNGSSSTALVPVSMHGQYDDGELDGDGDGDDIDAESDVGTENSEDRERSEGGGGSDEDDDDDDDGTEMDYQHSIISTTQTQASTTLSRGGNDGSRSSSSSSTNSSSRGAASDTVISHSAQKGSSRGPDDEDDDDEVYEGSQSHLLLSSSSSSGSTAISGMIPSRHHHRHHHHHRGGWGSGGGGGGGGVGPGGIPLPDMTLRSGDSDNPTISHIARKKLSTLMFRGDVDGARYMREFEKLVERAQRDMSDDDKRVLLTTSFQGSKVNIWYEELDIDDSMPYEELKGALVDRFRGLSRRGKKLEGGALLDF